MTTIILLIFILGYLLIAMESKIHINKAAIALIMAPLLWTLYTLASPETIIQANTAAFHEFLSTHPDYISLTKAEQVVKFIVNSQIVNQLGNVAEILFYLLGALTIVELIDIHKGFQGITDRITTNNKKKLLWLTGEITFFMSSVLDNMTSAIVMMTLLQKILNTPQDRWTFGGIIIIAANAGGAWTPIGDVTTIMLWIGDNITSGHIMQTLFFPALISLIIPLWLVSLKLKGNIAHSDTPPLSSSVSASPTPKERNYILILGILSLLAVPVFKSLTQLPPFAGILLALGMLWVYTEIMYNHQKGLPTQNQYRMSYVLSKIDFSSILFFLGILLAVAALDAIGILNKLAVFSDKQIHNVYLVSIIFGLLSSVIDNVPLVAACMAMYPVISPQSAAQMPEPGYMLNFVKDGTFWELIAYCTGTGGSLLIIGSAAGVVVMGLEKISFIWYLKHISWLALVGFFSGIGIYILQKTIFGI